MRWLMASLIIAVGVFLITGGHVLFLPLLFILPLGLLGGRRRRARHQRAATGQRWGR